MIRQAAPHILYGWWAVFLLETGMRVGEFIVLEWKDVDLKNALYMCESQKPTVTKCKSHILAGKQKYKDIDASYYLTGDENGILNAFEEFSVRSLTIKL